MFPLPDLMEEKYVSLDMLSFWCLALRAGTVDLKCLCGSSRSSHLTVKQYRVVFSIVFSIMSSGAKPNRFFHSEIGISVGQDIFIFRLGFVS